MRRISKRSNLAAVALAMILATFAAPADAGGSCFAAPNTVTFMPNPGPGTFTMFVASDGEIMVREPTGVTECDGTVSNTDSITVDIGVQRQIFRINMAGPGGEFPDGITWNVGLGDGRDTIGVLGGAGADAFWFFRLADTGDPVDVIDLHGGDGHDVNLTGVERATGATKGGADDMFASHFNGAGAFRMPVRFAGGGGSDTVVGGRRSDRLSGGQGRDLLVGFHGDDLLIGGAGDRDFCDGERGRDRLRGCESGEN
jgi:Ca2+-binding RTX toxin-like protein